MLDIKIQCAGCLDMVNISNTKKIGKYYFCSDCRSYIIINLKTDVIEDEI